MKITKHKIYYIFAGVNGAGKTTLYRTNAVFNLGVRINNDEIIHNNNWDWKSEIDQKKSFFTTFQILQEAINNNEDILSQ